MREYFKVMKNIIRTILIASAALCAACGPQEPQKTVLQIGHFPNITHAQALVAHNLSRQGKGWFEERLGDDVKIEWRLFNAGPTAMESLFAGAVDITYVGPNPAINAYAKTGGADIRVLAGAADGGAALIVNPDLNITKPEDFRGKKIGTPQFGNTQDVACRAWLIENGIEVTQTGGEASVLPTPNPEQLTLFRGKNLDAVWTVEPWVTRLINEGNGKIFLEQKDAVTTILVTNNRTLKKYPELVKKFVRAHEELTEWMKNNPEEAQKLAHAELEALTGGKIDMQLVKDAWPRIIFTSETNKKGMDEFVGYAFKCGFLKEQLDLSKIFTDAGK